MPALFQVDDWAVFAGHGVGRVVSRGFFPTPQGRTDCYAWEGPTGMRTLFPVEDANALRPVVSRDELDRVFAELRASAPMAAHPSRDDGFQERFALRRRGRPEDLARLLRILHDECSCRGDEAGFALRRQYILVRGQLATEIAITLDVPRALADARIEAALTEAGTAG